MEVRLMHSGEIDAAANVYHAALQHEIPPGQTSIQNVKRILSRVKTIISHGVVGINGVVTFVVKGVFGKYIQMDFIGAVEKGVGSKLMYALAKYAEKYKIKIIHSEVSEKDPNALGFYLTKCGFSTHGKRKIREGFNVIKISVSVDSLLKRLQNYSDGVNI
jgi:hypothetical protein